ncbi:hypothetical protein C922_02104 [Plasmodium inui San Antonio 1]|uniref:BSD domain-containing protein n=1 Tax=Plasmodium inui San Antonio 1 TaxID=1237626 RepID=W7A7X5_9APIC|nr:hypothetical protein C922_02104 [Plasmodium inui San Antonio 1]EUD67398.1 hypothetical protein C922_02104 [Plasmodium inui San Antonio 1]
MEEEKVHASFEVLYNNEKGELYVTSRYLVYISEQTKKEKAQSNSLFLIDDIDLKLCIFSWKKTEKSKKKSKTRFTFSITNKKNNFCFHDYNNTESYIFEFFYDEHNNKICQIINTLNKDNIKNHIYIEFNLHLIRDKYKVYEESSGPLTKDQSRGVAEEQKGDQNIHHVSIEDVPPKEIASSHFIKNADDEPCRQDKDIAAKGDSTTKTRDHLSEKNGESDHSEGSHISEDNAEENESLSSLHRMFETDAQLKGLYQMCIQNNILTEEEFYKMHKSDIYEYRNISSSAEEGILKEPLFITEEQKMAKSVEINKQISRVILSENKELKKLYDYYMANNILNESKFWFFLFNNKYSHLFFYDKNEKDIMGNKNFFSIKSDQQNRPGGVATDTTAHTTDDRRDVTRTTDEEENTYYKNLSLSYDMDNPNQDIKGTLEKCILKEYLSTKSYRKKNILFDNNYYFNEESAQGFGLFTNEKYSKGRNSHNLLINKFNNYCIGMIKDKKFTLDTFYEDLKNKIEDTDLNPMKQKKELQFQIMRKKKKRPCDSEADNEESAQAADRLNEKFTTLLEQMNTFKQNTGRKNYSDLFNIGRLLFVSNTKKCQSNQSMLIGTIEYEQHILDIVKDYHVKVNYLLNLFYTSCIPEQAKRNKILQNLSKIKEEIQAKQEEYNSVLIMGKPLLIHLFEQISICKKFNEKLDRYIQEKRKKS